MKAHKKVIIGFIITIILLIGAFVAYYLSQKPQEVRQHAAEKPFGKAAVFSATNSATEPVTTVNTVTHDKDFTLEFWVNPTGVRGPDGNNFMPFVETATPHNSSSCVDQFVIGGERNTETNTYSVHASTFPPSGSNVLLTSDSSPIRLNEWAHVAFSINNTTHVAKLFVNGKQMDAGAIPQTFCSDLTYRLGYDIADDGDNSPINYVGQMDEMRLSDTIRYDSDFTPSNTPFLPDSQTLGLWHFDGNLNNEFDNQPMNDPTNAVTYTDSTLPVTATPPACQANISTCSWDAVDTAVSYHYKITQIITDDDAIPTPGANIIKEGDIQSPGTSVTFVSEANATYTCEVAATNACGTGEKASATATCAVPTATPTPTPTTTPIPSATPTSSPTPTPTSTPTPTPVPSATPTPTKPPVIPTSTVVPPTPTTVVPTATPVPPTATAVVPTNTVGPNTPTPTLPSPGSAVQTLTIAGGIIFTIVGALILFIL